MSDREVDQSWSRRARAEDYKHVISDKQPAFEFCPQVPSAKLERLLSRVIREPKSEDVAQEAFIKAERPCPTRATCAFYTGLYRIGINTAKNT